MFTENLQQFFTVVWATSVLTALAYLVRWAIMTAYDIPEPEDGGIDE